MAIKIINSIHCDTQECMISQEYPDYEFPKGWKYRIQKGKIVHSCPECSQILLKTGYKHSQEDKFKIVSIRNL